MKFVQLYILIIQSMQYIFILLFVLYKILYIIFNNSMQHVKLNIFNCYYNMK